MERFDSMKDLYNKLITIEIIKNKIKCDDKKIEIVLHEDLIILIELDQYFNIYVNGLLSCGKIEEQDIWEIIHIYLQEDNVFVESKGLLGRQRIYIIDRAKFERQKEKLLRKPKIKIYTTRELIYQSC